MTATAPPPASAPEPEADFALIALPCPNKKCGRVFVMIAARGTVKIKCRDCKTQATYEVDGERIVSFHMDKPPKERKRR